MITGAAATRRTIVRVRSSDALAISDTVHPTASTAPKNPAAAGAMPASRWPNNGTYMSTIVAAINNPIVTYIHFSGPGPNAARGNTVARARRSTSRKSHDQHRTDGEQAESRSAQLAALPRR